MQVWQKLAQQTVIRFFILPGEEKYVRKAGHKRAVVKEPVHFFVWISVVCIQVGNVNAEHVAVVSVQNCFHVHKSCEISAQVVDCV